MSWEERPLEKYVQWLLSEKLQADGEKLWAAYQNTRNEIVDKVLPWIAKHGGGLTDHGDKHIADVIDNAYLLLGYPNHFDVSSFSKEPCHDFSPHEMLILLAGLLLHDIGNIYGRNRHNQKIGEVWSSLASWDFWNENEKRLFIEVGQAHCGEGVDNSPDTIKGLAVTPRYFKKSEVRLGQIAAVIRFADELAEGPQRTSTFLIENKLIETDSQLYHHYAEVVTVSISRTRGRVALTYHIRVDNIAYPTVPSELAKHLASLLEMVYARAAKMNYERQYARHYADVLSPFRETSISITFLRNGSPIELPLEPITLNDINVLSTNPSKQIEQLNSGYLISSLVEKILGGAHV